jgi:hypothetical protein
MSELKSLNVGKYDHIFMADVVVLQLCQTKCQSTIGIELCPIRYTLAHLGTYQKFKISA